MFVNDTINTDNSTFVSEHKIFQRFVLCDLKESKIVASLATVPFDKLWHLS